MASCKPYKEYFYLLFLCLVLVLHSYVQLEAEELSTLCSPQNHPHIQNTVTKKNKSSIKLKEIINTDKEYLEDEFDFHQELPAKALNVYEGKCSNGYRVSRMRAYCDDHWKEMRKRDVKGKNLITKHWPWKLLYIDRKNKLLMCIPPKTGSGTWKAIWALNVLNVTAKQTENYEYMEKVFEEKSYWHPKTLQDLEEVKDYFKIMLTRHPIDRVESCWNGKLNRKNPNNEFRDTDIMIQTKYQDTTDTKTTMSDFLKFMQAEREYEGLIGHHYTPLYEDCHPCLINYDYIVKIETHAKDASYIVNNWMQGHALWESRNVRRQQYQGFLLSTGRVLNSFADVSKNLTDFMLDYFKHDMEMFGYHFDVNRLKATCKNKSGNKYCC